MEGQVGERTVGKMDGSKIGLKDSQLPSKREKIENGKKDMRCEEQMLEINEPWKERLTINVKKS